MSGSPGASDEANRVVYACLAALDLLEAGGEPLREKYPATGGLAAAFYGALRAVHGPRAGRGRRAGPRRTPPRGRPSPGISPAAARRPLREGRAPRGRRRRPDSPRRSRLVSPTFAGQQLSQFKSPQPQSGARFQRSRAPRGTYCRFSRSRGCEGLLRYTAVIRISTGTDPNYRSIPQQAFASA